MECNSGIKKRKKSIVNNIIIVFAKDGRFQTCYKGSERKTNLGRVCVCDAG